MTPWQRATMALTLLAIDPQSLGGVVVRARSGPARDALLAGAAKLPMPSVRLHPHMTAQVLDGDIDLSATLSGGTLVKQRGLLDRLPSLFILPMAERIDPYMSARLGQALDAGHSHALLALDEGSEDAQTVPPALSDRTAFHVTLDHVAMADLSAIPLPENLSVLRRSARKVIVPPAVLSDLVTLAVSLGISSLRAPTFALNAAQTHAAWQDRDTLTADDVAIAVALVYAHRATQMPHDDATENTPQDANQDSQPQDQPFSIPKDILLDAIKAVLPPNLLANLDAQTSKRAAGVGSGAKRISNRRGRPLPARTGSKASAARVDLIATLRAAIPWQTLRKNAEPARIGPIFRQSDLRHKCYQTLSDRLLIFTVDASGSAAMARLAEAKGAVELLLSEAYARRDHVALIAFRGTDADLILPPTRSLVQTKKRLAALPGGGGTPLAAGLTAALALAQTTTQKGLTPTIVLLTDGRANVALDGTGNRKLAATDAQLIAKKINAARVEAIVIDTTMRPERALQELAQTMDATYIPLPRADAKGVSAAISTSLGS